VCSKGGRVGVRRATKLHTAQSPSRFCAQQGGGGGSADGWTKAGEGGRGQGGEPRRVRGVGALGFSGLVRVSFLQNSLILIRCLVWVVCDAWGFAVNSFCIPRLLHFERWLWRGLPCSAGFSALGYTTQ
jgi:hypothetical protein